MTLAPGSRIGPYQIAGPLGSGGMGDVYRARDARLNRDVAIKALPPSSTTDPDRVARFEREAQALAALNHPHIAVIYGLEQTGDHPVIVLELVEGGTIADRLAAGPLPVRDALQIARDVADALEAAHSRNVIHRDIKPANIGLTATGQPKVLDFGLAKALGADDMSSPVQGATHTGVVLGTIPYMSPEQTRGAAVDKRSDIWAFGCVLYEMLTGRHPFGGGSVSDTVAAILERDPDFTALPATTPERVRWLLRRCLQKDPRRRLHDIADARIELEEAILRADSGETHSVTADGGQRSFPTRERTAWMVAAVAIGFAVLAVALRPGARVELPTISGALYRASIALPDDLRLLPTEDPSDSFAVSPDGRTLAFVASSGTGASMLWLRPLDSSTAHPLAGTEGAMYPFWSPDSRSIAFIARSGQLPKTAQGMLKRVETAGGQPLTLATVSIGAAGAWSRDGLIIFTPSGNSGLARVPANGGSAPTPLTTLDTDAGDVQHSYPAFLPDGRHYLFTVVGSRAAATGARAVYLASLDGRTPPRVLLEPGGAVKHANGHLLYMRGRTLLAQRFDVETLSLAGEAFPLAEQVGTSGSATAAGSGAFSVSNTGILIYQTTAPVWSQLTWFDAAGKRIGTTGEPADYSDVVLSPDGTRAMVSTLDQELGTRDLWIVDIARGTRERFTSEPWDDFAPVWSPHGDHIAYTSTREGTIDIYERALDGSGERRLEGGSALGKFAASWSPDGEWLLFIAGGRVIGRSDVHVMPVKGGAPRAFLETTFIETQARFSPDGRWVAYTMNDSGRTEVYVRPFPGPGERRRVSLDGGGWPLWRRDGKEIFFLAQEKLMSAPVAYTDAGLQIGNPRARFAIPLRPRTRLDAYSYAVAPDGQRFLFNTFVEAGTASGFTLVVNWPLARQQ